MTSSTRLSVIIAAGAVVAAGLSLAAGRTVARWVKNWRRKSPEEIERLRRLSVNRTGRITSGQIVDLVEAGAEKRRVVVYQYEVAGVTYEASQEISGFADFPASGIAGLTSSVKYDRQKPMNSIIACEDWNGLTGASKAVMSDE